MSMMKKALQGSVASPGDSTAETPHIVHTSFPQSAERSASYLMYRHLFKDRVSVDVDELLQQMPERFLLSNLDQIFGSWKSALDTLGGIGYLPLLTDKSGIRKALNYDHDHHKYRSDTYIEVYNGNSLLCIKLANNGFLYPPEAHLQVVTNSTTERHRNVFVKLMKGHLNDFKGIVQFAKNYLNSRVKVQLFYSYMGDRMDLKMFDVTDSTRGVVVTFEKFDPVDDLFDEDYWLLEDDEGSELV